MQKPRTDPRRHTEEEYQALRTCLREAVDALKSKMQEYKPHDEGYCGDCDFARKVLTKARELLGEEVAGEK